MANRSMSIRTMSRILFSLLIPLTVLLGCASVHQVGSAYIVERQRTQERFELELERLEEELLRPESYMSSLLMQSEAVQQLYVPTVSLLTFVENSLKYGGTPQPCLRIEIIAKRMMVEEGPFLHLIVRDNGSGFPQGMVDQLNVMDWNEDTGGHIGLKNVIRRFQLLYHEKTHVMFYNEKGAIVEMFAPITLGLEEAKEELR